MFQDISKLQNQMQYCYSYHTGCVVIFSKKKIE